MTKYKMASRPKRVAAAALGVVLLSGCSQAADSPTPPELTLSPTATPSGPVTSPGSASSAASGSAASSSREQQIAAGSEAIRAYRQMIFDIYADPTPNVQDMRKVATGELLDRDMEGLRTNLQEGWRDTPGTVTVKWVKPVSIKTREMRLYACVDPNGILAKQGNKPARAAKKQAYDYKLKLVGDSWLVFGTVTHGGAKSVKSC